MARLILITVILSILSAFAYGLVQYGISLERAEWRWEQLKAVEAARSDEKRKQGLINDAIQVQYDEISNINDTLLNDLDELRSRPERSEMPDNTGVACEAGNGAELAREYARFLIRYSTQAAVQDSALAACYSAYDSLTLQAPSQ